MSGSQATSSSSSRPPLVGVPAAPDQRIGCLINGTGRGQRSCRVARSRRVNDVTRSVSTGLSTRSSSLRAAPEPDRGSRLVPRWPPATAARTGPIQHAADPGGQARRAATRDQHVQPLVGGRHQRIAHVGAGQQGRGPRGSKHKNLRKAWMSASPIAKTRRSAAVSPEIVACGRTIQNGSPAVCSRRSPP